MADAVTCCCLHAQGEGEAEDLVWLRVVHLLYEMGGGRALEDALLASPELAARAAHNVLAAAAAWCSPAERPEYALPALVATGFAANALSSYAAH